MRSCSSYGGLHNAGRHRNRRIFEDVDKDAAASSDAIRSAKGHTGIAIDTGGSNNSSGTNSGGSSPSTSCSSPSDTGGVSAHTGHHQEGQHQGGAPGEHHTQ